MRKIYILQILLILWLITVFYMIFPINAKADNGQEERPMVAFTFDDGPNCVQTARLLDGLKKRNAKATFFVVGEKLDYESGKYSEKTVTQSRALVDRMATEGHTVANHSYSHCWLSKATKEKVTYELRKTNELITQITGQPVKYMRPPGGSALTTSWVREIASPMITVCWGYYDTRDWECRNVDSMVDMIVNNTFDGDIILLHDNYETSVDTALQAMDILAEKGYRFVTIDELLNRNTGNGWTLDPTRIYCTMKPGDYSRLKKEKIV